MARLKITKEFWRLQLMEIKQDKPTCSVCSKQLKTGDFVDKLYPFETKYNICKVCILREAL